MGISLRKGGNVSLSKAGGSSSTSSQLVSVDERVTDGADFDLDATAFCLGANGKFEMMLTSSSTITSLVLVVLLNIRETTVMGALMVTMKKSLSNSKRFQVE